MIPRPTSRRGSVSSDDATAEAIVEESSDVSAELQRLREQLQAAIAERDAARAAAQAAREQHAASAAAAVSSTSDQLDAKLESLLEEREREIRAQLSETIDGLNKALADETEKVLAHCEGKTVCSHSIGSGYSAQHCRPNTKT